MNIMQNRALKTRLYWAIISSTIGLDWGWDGVIRLIPSETLILTVNGERVLKAQVSLMNAIGLGGQGTGGKVLGVFPLSSVIWLHNLWQKWMKQKIRKVLLWSNFGVLWWESFVLAAWPLEASPGKLQAVAHLVGFLAVACTDSAVVALWRVN